MYRVDEQGRPDDLLPHETTVEGDEATDLPALALAFVFLAYACLLPFLREYGTAGLAIPAACAASMGLIYGRRYLQVSLGLLAAVGAVYIGLSFAGYLHRDITLLFDRGAIFQQAFYTLVLVLLVPACAHYHSQVERDAPGWRGLETAILVLALATKLALGLSGMRLGGLGLGISQLINADAIAAFIIVRRFGLDPERAGGLRWFVAALFLLTAGSFQSAIVGVFLVALLLFPNGARGLATGAIVGLVAVVLASLPFAREIWWWDFNTGVRLLFWQDVFERFLASDGLGVGFGTETIKPVYQVGIEEHVISGLEREGYLNIAAHNAYVDAFYRMGVFGGTVVVLYFATLFARTLSPLRAPSAFDCWVASTLALSLMINVALASVAFIFGTGMLAGWLVHRTTRQSDA